MKQITKLLLIHWHYFSHELITFDKINFLTGITAAGKSTIIDALQLLLLADTSGTYFNKAANGKSTRTLIGYLTCELGDDGESGFRSLRSGKRFTSYICAEFYDDQKKVYLTAGCCFDYFSENDLSKLFFYFDDRLPENEFIENGTSMSIAELRRFMNGTYAQNRRYTTETNKDFREKLYGKLGGLPRKFGSLLRKAVPFNPIADIQQFITEFVCDEQQNVDISLMQENIRSYRNLEEESEKLQIRLQALNQINETFSNYKNFEEQEHLYRYLIDRSNLDLIDEELKKKKRQLQRDSELIEKTYRLIDESKKKRDHLNDECNNRIADLQKDEAKQTLDRLNGMKDQLDQKVTVAEEKFSHYQNLMSNTLLDWRQRTKKLETTLDADLAVFESTMSERITSFFNNVKRLDGTFSELLADRSAGALMTIGYDALKQLFEKSSLMGKRAYNLKSRLTDEENETARKIKESKDEFSLLQRGQIRYPKQVTDLRETLLSELQMEFGTSVRLDILAQLLEIKDERWRNTIEGYMNTQKFYILVSPKHFRTALEIYNRIKRQRNIYNARLVDIDRVKMTRPVCQSGSLAEEIETDDPDARVYIDYLLGCVMKCDHVAELRNFSIAVTDEGMLYQGFTVGRINPNAWAKPAIGRNAIKLKMEQVREQLRNLNTTLSLCVTLKLAASLMSDLVGVSDSEIEQTLLAAEKYQNIPELKKQMKKIEDEIQSINTNHLKALQRLINELKQEIELAQNEFEHYIQKKSDLEANVKVLNNDIPYYETQIAEERETLSEHYTQEWIDQTGMPKYEHELRTNKSLKAIHQNFNSPLQKAVKNKNEQWTHLRDFRKDYITLYKLGYDIDDQENVAFEKATLALKNIHLPDYQKKIEDARKKAFEQFQEDFLSKLQSNIHAAESQINKLNDAIRRIRFGEDTYRFKVVPREEYRRFYTMITSDMLLSGYNLLSNEFNETYKEEIADLFSMITASDHGDREDYEKRVKEFTNYRTYLTFDLEVLDQNGNPQRLSRTLGKKSGGETQTPFYIAVLASFAQIYRIGRDKNANTARIIIFDEAFSKMDGNRIIQSIELLRKFDFQVILSAPPEKIGDIATLVDRNLCVLRKGSESTVRNFTPKEIGDLFDSES